MSAAKKEAAPKAPKTEKPAAKAPKAAKSAKPASTKGKKVVDIKAAVELMFGVKVDKVAVVNETGKTRRFGKLQGRTQDIKKAYVRLAPGQTIDYEAKIKA